MILIGDIKKIEQSRNDIKRNIKPSENQGVTLTKT